MNNLKIGDHVRHKIKFLNGGVPMVVEAIKGVKAKCSFIKTCEVNHKTVWFDFDELNIVHYGDG